MGDLRIEVADHIATVTIDRPPVNATTRATLDEIARTFSTIADDRDVRVVIFTGAGDRAFIAGADTKAHAADRALLDSGPPSDFLDPGGVARRAMDALYHCPVPVVGAINGPAIGAGFVFASLCDIVVAAHGATFHLNEINVGLLGASAHAVRMLGPHIARKMLFTGIPIPVEELEPLRVVDRVVPREELLDAAHEIASVLAAKSPIALRLAKLSMNQSEGMPFAAGYRVEQFYTDKLLRFEDAGEARAAFNEQRAPDWKWR